jgi:alanyl-tRNA synthetase
MWLASEEEGFSRTIAQGMHTLGEYVAAARAAGAGTLSAEQVFRLHDTYGFPQDMTRELLEREGLGIEGDFETLMDEQRRRGRATARRATGETTELTAAAATLGADAPAVSFTGYEHREQQTAVLAVGDGEGELKIVKLAQSPFYAPGGGQVADTGVIEALDGGFRGRVVDVLRLGDDQALAVEIEGGELAEGEQVLARVDARERHAIEANHTATHLLQAALRRVLGEHVRQAGSYVGPDKLRFDFSHGKALSDAELAQVEELVNGWISENDSVHALTTTLDEAKRMGAMALFGEKYGEIVRLVEVGEGDYSRELCGGTHVRSTAEIGPFTIIAETSSSANVRRIEALTGPAAVEHLLARDRVLRELAAELRTRPDEVPQAVERLAQERKRLEKEVRAGAAAGQVDAGELAAEADELDGTRVLATTVEVADPKALMDTLDRVRGQLPSGAVVLGAIVDDRVHLAVAVSEDLIARGVKAGAIVKVAAAEVGGGGGGRDGVAQAGGRDPEGLPRALDAARGAIREALGA